MSNRFYSQGNWKAGDTISLDSEQSRHAAKVLRLTEGSTVELFNGVGLLGQGKLLEVGRKLVDVEVLSAEAIENPCRLVLAFSLGKPPVTEFILRRATELGVRAFQPLKSAHSHPGDFKSERWEKILLEVCKQCQQVHVPELRPMISLEKWLQEWKQPLWVCDEADRQAVPQVSLQSGEVAVLVGAEGGWDRAEVETVRRHSAGFLGLGKNRLRAETAAIVATTLVKLKLGEIPSF